MSDIHLDTTLQLAHVRSLLFAPGDDERKLRSALASPAHAVVVDLEDAVQPADAYERRRSQNERVFAGDHATVDLRVVERARRMPAETERSQRSGN